MAETLSQIPGVSDDDYKALVAAGAVPSMPSVLGDRPAAAPAMIPSVAPMRGVMNPVKANDMQFDIASGQERTAHPTMPAPAIPAVGAAPQISAAPDTSALAGGGIPSLAAPTKQQSHAAGKAEYAAGLPHVTATPFTPEYYQQEQELADFKAAHPLGSDVSARPGFLGKLEHGLARVGNIAGDVFAPEVMENISGTDLNKEIQNRERVHQFSAATEAEQREAAAKNLTAETAKTNAGLAGSQPIGEPKQDAEGNWFQAAKDPNGNVKFESVAGGPTSPNLSGKTPAEQTYDSLLKQTNPATGKPYTAQEALAEVQKGPPTNETQEDARFEKIQQDAQLKKPVSPEDQAWANAYKERKSLGPQAAAAAGAANATLTPLINPATGQMMGTFNTKTGEFKPQTQNTGGATTAAGAGVGNKQIEAFNKDYVNPAEAIERSYQMFQDAYKAIQAGDAKTGAEDMLLLSQHLGTTFGQVKGSRMNKDLIEEHKDAIGIQDRIQRYANNLASGQMLSPDQRKEFGDLISNMRNLTWQIATKEAARNNQPINFLPPDVQVNMRDSKGVTRPVSGDRVQEYLDKGAHLGG